MKSILILASVFILSGCYAQSHFESDLQTWVGQSTSSLFEGWGPPTSTFDLPDGRKMYTWANNSGAVAIPVAGTVYAVPRGCEITFTVSTTGSVETWRYKGNNCY
jgi:hypothetical protein